jgi:hypothetical protein
MSWTGARSSNLTREPDPSDQRSKHIHGTPRRHAAGKAIREIVQEVEAE